MRIAYTQELNILGRALLGRCCVRLHCGSAWWQYHFHCMAISYWVVQKRRWVQMGSEEQSHSVIRENADPVSNTT